MKNNFKNLIILSLIIFSQSQTYSMFRDTAGLITKLSRTNLLCKKLNIRFFSTNFIYGNEKKIKEYYEHLKSHGLDFKDYENFQKRNVFLLINRYVNISEEQEYKELDQEIKFLLKIFTFKHTSEKDLEEYDALFKRNPKIRSFVIRSLDAPLAWRTMDDRYPEGCDTIEDVIKKIGLDDLD